MKVGLQVPSYTWPPGPAQIAPTLDDVARTARTRQPGRQPPLLEAELVPAGTRSGRTTTPDPGGAK